MARQYRSTAFLITFLYLLAQPTLGQVTGSCDSPTSESTLDIANVRARIYANGNLFWRNGGSPDYLGYEVPKGSGVSAILTSGLWVGGKVDGELRVAAARYENYSFWSGPLSEEGAPPIDCSQYDRIWKVNRLDVGTFESGGQPTLDLLEWPTGLGAPTLSPFNADGTLTNSDRLDNDADGLVDEAGEMRSITDEILELPLNERIGRTIDLEAGERPDLLGDQMLWWILNDVGNAKVYSFQADGETPDVVSPPIGLEVHASAFAFSIPGDIKNATFYRFQIYNKGDADLTEAYLGLFADVELGNPFDDYIASDSTLGLGFVYNADNEDEGPLGYGGAPPALAYGFLQGPLVESGLDTAIVLGGIRLGFRELPMTSFIGFYNSYGPQGYPMVPSEYYNYMRAYWKDGTPLTIGDRGYLLGNPATKFMFPADPTTGAFWSEYSVRCDPAACPPSDRHSVMGSGPFRIDRNKKQDVFYAISWAQGEDNLDSYTKTRLAARRAQSIFDTGLNGFSQNEVPTPFQNELGWSAVYPTPGRGRTTLEYSLPSEVDVAVEVLDILGRKMMSIERRIRDAGLHSVPFDTTSWPAGIYFVRIALDGRHLAHQRFIVL